MTWTFSERARKLTSSAIREILKVTERPEVISFAGGLPSPATFPVDRIRDACNHILNTAPSPALQYGPTEGYMPLREWVAERYSRNGVKIGVNQVLITTGSQQGLDLLGKVLIDVGSRVLVLGLAYKKDIDDIALSFDSVREMATRYRASIASTGSRLATYSAEPCAFMLIEEGVIRYASLSKGLREKGGYIEFGVPVPPKSVAARLIRDPSSTDVYDEIPADIWFNKPLRNYELVCEEAMASREFDQCWALVWLDDGLRRASTGNRDTEDDDDPLLTELDGILPWPGKSRRR